ncbi:PREDICTED: uncharacterized protein LOC109227619 [Nicotiana attenuata]|uniref:uncharacterized protein LOC109227619 n=1 Tax=Nicotiana attenuata TaxID=49451 RepID=UPI0009046EFF|nr:PREDICTED: uncharacterized protein LOC109227619 [Nicotiana attenuata]
MLSLCVWWCLRKDLCPENKKIWESEEDFDDLPIASLTKRRRIVAQESTPKRPTTRLQRKEALESALKKSQAKSRRRKLVKDGKAVSKKSVPVMNVDEDEADEPGSLTRKLSQKHGLSKPKRVFFVSAENLNKSDAFVSSENVVKESGDKCVEEFGASVMEELGEKSMKSDEKEKNVRKSAKRKADTYEEPGSSKKARVGEPRSAGKERLRSQNVLRGRTFAPDILEEAGMRQLVEICEFQQCTHLFTSDSPKVYEEEDQSFYADLFKVEDDHICVLVNEVDMDKAVQQGERFQKKALLPLYQLLFEIVFKHLKVPLGQVKVGTKKQTFSKATLEECECIEKVRRVGSTSTISQLINAQNSATTEIRQFKARNAILETQLSQLQEAPGSSSSQSEEVERLTKENAELRKQVEDLKERLLNEQMSANARMDLVLQTLSSASKPSPSSAP